MIFEWREFVVSETQENAVKRVCMIERGICQSEGV